MTFLLDTHVLLWWLFDDPKLSRTVRGLIEEPEHTILVSAASAWEISTKHRLGKLRGVEELLEDMGSWVVRAGFRQLPILISHAQLAGSWPQAHKDPFDRMLAAQSAIEKVPLITRDEQLASFDIRVIW